MSNRLSSAIGRIRHRKPVRAKQPKRFSSDAVQSDCDGGIRRSRLVKATTTVVETGACQGNRSQARLSDSPSKNLREQEYVGLIRVRQEETMWQPSKTRGISFAVVTQLTTADRFCAAHLPHLGTPVICEQFTCLPKRWKRSSLSVPSMGARGPAIWAATRGI